MVSLSIWVGLQKLLDTHHSVQACAVRVHFCPLDVYIARLGGIHGVGAANRYGSPFGLCDGLRTRLLNGDSAEPCCKEEQRDV